MLDPDKLATYIDAGNGNATPPPDLRRIASEIDALNEKHRRIYDAYAKEHITAEAYIETSRAIDEGIVALRGQRDALLTAWRRASSAETLRASLRQFCATARARFEACDDFDAKRAFLQDYVQRVTFDHGKVTILGSLPHEGTAQGKVSFSIAGRIAKGSKRRWPQDERFGSWVPNQCLGRVLN